eukprot:TRINITY_DN7980_c1_g1_i1.p1 TRINITY_DN7980_c1_g1~~TRINITY_DN7980_c1_g1_i1.p1  ORF type:complete len:875 (+),score=198.67 TRINITY_DN7980_c1_g1_i1:181-2805(+)
MNRLIFVVLVLVLVGIARAQSNIPLTAWDVIAPFPLGMREQGADPLEAFGGIFNIPRGGILTYPTDLVFGGRAAWQSIQADSSGSVTIQYNSSYVDWDLIEGWAGEAGSMFQGWGLADFSIAQDTQIVLFCAGVSVYYLDNIILRGDSYGVGYMWNSLSVSAGNHTLRVKFSGGEEAGWQCVVQDNTGFLASNSPLFPFSSDVILPDIVDGQFSAPYGSIAVMNQGSQLVTDAVVEAVVLNPTNLTITVSTLPTTFGPSQTRPLAFNLKVNYPECQSGDKVEVVFVVFSKSYAGLTANNVTVTLTCKKFLTDPYCYTFLDFDGSVQYSMARAPVYPCTQPNGCPILFTLHGAGVEASSNAWTYAYSQQNYSYTLFPTNRRAYGFDWQNSGFFNALNALLSFTSLLPGVPASNKTAYAANQYRVIYAGHSMGGHGCWTFSSHYPDRALAFAPAAGWISMETYLPYFIRVGDSWIDPYVKQIMMASISDWNDDFYTPNMVGVPLLIRMGSDDDNVPPFHLKRMARLVQELSHNASTAIAQVSEIPGQGHWFNGVVDDAIMQAFFNQHILNNLPPLPQTFVVTTMNPGTSEGRGGVKILQFTIPYRAARIKVTQNGNQWVLKTENVRRFGFDSFDGLLTPSNIIIDGTPFTTSLLPTVNYCNLNNNFQWAVCNDNGEWEQTERGPKTYGPMINVIINPLVIVWGTKDDNPALEAVRNNIATFLANTFYFQERYSIPIMPDYLFDPTILETSNVIIIGGPETNFVAAKLEPEFPNGLSFVGQNVSIGGRVFDTPKTGVLFDFQCGGNLSLCAVMEGTDLPGLLKAANLFPVSSSVTVPDFVVAGPEWGYAGAGGLLAAGFWDNFWSYDPSLAYVTTLY